MTTKVDVGDRVIIRAGDERGGWGVVAVISGAQYHVKVYGGEARVYLRSEIRKSS